MIKIKESKNNNINNANDIDSYLGVWFNTRNFEKQRYLKIISLP